MNPSNLLPSWADTPTRASIETALDHACDRDWIVVTVKNDWTTVFADG